MYVLAQFPDDAPLEWVARLRAAIGKDEIKHVDYVNAQLAYYNNRELWRAVDLGISKASIFIVDPHTYVVNLVPELLKSGMEFGVDFDWNDILEQAAVAMIAETPAYEISSSRMSMELSQLGSAFTDFYSQTVVNSLPLPAAVLARLGGTIRHATRFVARAHAVFEFALDGAELQTAFATEAVSVEARPRLTTRKFDMVMNSTLSTHRVFDREDNRSIQILTETAETLSAYSIVPQSETLYLREEDSRNVDALQAADITAGIARTLIDKDGLRALANRFRKVRVNGVDLDSALR
jgi:hypothetical protein